MTHPALSEWMGLSQKIREKLRGRRGREEIEELLDRLETVALNAGREIEREAVRQGLSGPRFH